MDAAIETLKEQKFYLEFRLEENKDESILIQKIITKKINQLDYAIKLLELNLN